LVAEIDRLDGAADHAAGAARAVVIELALLAERDDVAGPRDQVGARRDRAVLLELRHSGPRHGAGAAGSRRDRGEPCHHPRDCLLHGPLLPLGVHPQLSSTLSSQSLSRPSQASSPRPSSSASIATQARSSQPSEASTRVISPARSRSQSSPLSVIEPSTPRTQPLSGSFATGSPSTHTRRSAS